jgi:short-subunit dehydrogenase
MTTALITGASSGIGRILAELCAAEHQDLVLVARRDMSAQADELKARFGVQVESHRVDLSVPGAAARVFEAVGGRPVDVLINNAGYGRYGPFIGAPHSDVTAMICTNVLALAELTHLVVPGMVQRGNGRVLQVASTAAYQPGPSMALYYASKAFVLSLSEALSLELAGTGVTITTLCPGPTSTEFNDTAGFKVTKLAELTSMTADTVARAGFNAMNAGHRVCVPGPLNKFTAVSAQMLPRAWVLRMTAALTKSRE